MPLILVIPGFCQNPLMGFRSWAASAKAGAIRAFFFVRAARSVAFWGRDWYKIQDATPANGLT